jgi:hypothetical protein
MTVRTLTFDSITTRRGVWNFPDTTHTFRKVLMHHTLKCSPLTTQDQFACGEWDYLTYSFIHDHTGVLDSTAMEHPWFRVGNQAPDTLWMSEAPVMDRHQVLLDGVSPVSVQNEVLHMTGDGTALDPDLLNTQNGGSRSQYLFTATELTSSGLGAGPIQQLRFVTDSDGDGQLPRLTVRMKGTNATELMDFEEVDLITVYDMTPMGVGTVTGEQVLHLATPFNWDGTSNILVDIAASSSLPLGGPEVIATNAVNMAVRDRDVDGYLSMANDHIAVDASRFAELGNAITVTFKVWGDASLPVNTSIFEALNADGRRILNVHLPWSNGRVYWDAGDDGSGNDRIDKEALTENLEGQWNHWAFVKNTSTGLMRIYLNGSLWHTGGGKTKPMDGITLFKIGSSGTGGNPFPGLLDEFNVFAAELSSATIDAWKDRKVDASHPDAAALLYTFHFDEDLDDPIATNEAHPDHNGVLMGSIQRMRYAATELGGAPMAIGLRPDLTFVTGEYTTETTNAIVEELVTHPMVAQQFFMVDGNTIASIDTVFGWTATPSYLFDPDGNVLDSVETVAVMSVNDTLHYFGVPFEVVDRYEVGRFITPYGINLSLGTNGFRWTYDVTDYQWLLHDSVDFSAGNQQELIDVTFEMIEGTPPREVVRMQRPWGQQRSYSYTSLSDDTSLAPVTVDLHPEATSFAVGTRFTGHGHASNTGNYPHCCEWKNNTHTLRVNGSNVDQWHIWQTNDCALNPVYPQGGTWLGAREGWCPGDLVKDHLVDITPHVAGSDVTLDYAITPVPSNNTGMGAGNYVVNMDLFEYAPAAFTLDAEIVNIERPSSTDQFRRDNPICYDPVVILRNAGSDVLTSVTFTYGVSGGTARTHEWSGSLDGMESTAVTLPVDDDEFWNGDDDHRFTVEVSAPNGGSDQHAANDRYGVEFGLPDVYDYIFVLDYRTNNRPQENTVTVRDMQGDVVFQRGSHTANTSYRDTLDLPAGCYTLEVLDTGNDGLSYWADTQQGSGYFRIRRLSNIIVQNFQAEFGRKIHWAWTYSTSVGIEDDNDTFETNAYPSPGNGLYTIALNGMSGYATIVVSDASGRTVLQERSELYGSDLMELDLRDQADGIYGIRVITEDHTASMRVIKQ